MTGEVIPIAIGTDLLWIFAAVMIVSFLVMISMMILMRRQIAKGGCCCCGVERRESDGTD